MPEKSQKRKLRGDQSTIQFDIETASSINDENAVLSERDFEDISNKIENKISKRLRDTELNQREILKLIENLSSKVDNLSSVNSEQGYLTTRTENSGNPTDELEEVSLSRNESSNISVHFMIIILLEYVCVQENKTFNFQLTTFKTIHIVFCFNDFWNLQGSALSCNFGTLKTYNFESDFVLK